MPLVGAFLIWLADHYDLVVLIYDAVTSGKLSKDQATKAVQDAIVAASDAEMAREFPKG